MEENLNIIIYSSEDGKTKLDVKLENETLWLNQKQRCELFGKSKSEFIRQSVLNSEPIDMKSFNDNFEKLIIQYKAVGNNINQLTRAVNQGRVKVEPQEFEKLRIEVNNLWVSLKSLKEGKA